MRLFNGAVGLLFATLLWPHLAYSVFVGPPSTSAGIVEREIQKEYETEEITPERKVPLLEIDIPEEQLELGEGQKVSISKIAIRGNEVFSCKSLEKMIAAYEHRDLSMKDIKELCLQLQEKYIQCGYFLARVYPPTQEIKDGNLVLEVIEGKLGTISIQGQKHYKEKFIRKFFAKFEGKAINYDELLRALFLVNENEDLQVGAVFKKGSEQGTADLILQVSDKRPCHLYVDENNYGAKNTTIWRTGAKFTYGNLFTDGDTIAVTEVVGNPASRLNFTNASYQIPLNTLGTEMKLNYVYSSFHVPQFASLHLRGRTQIGTVEFSQALARTRRWSSDVYTSFDYKQIHNYQMNQTSSYDKLRVFTFGFTLDYTDSFKGRNVGDIYYTCGVPHFLGGLKTKDPLCSRQGAGGNFSILNVDYTRIQTLPQNCFLMFHVAGQTTPYKLPISQQFYIGGVDSVRGFPIASALGDMGYNANLELRAALPYIGERKLPGSEKKWKDFLQIVGFVDQGGVLLNGGGENQQHHISMTGAGAGLRVFTPFRLNLSFDVGFPLTEEKKQSSPVYYFKASLQPF